MNCRDNDEPLRGPRKRAFLATTLLLVLAACENPQPPVSCGAIPQQTVAVGETGSVTACFNDPNGDVLAFAAVSANPGVASASATGTAVTVAALTPGNTSVTVTATDPAGLKGQQVFQVTVPNRPPLARGTMPDQTIIAGRNAVVNLSTFFTEPDGQKLSYSATAADPGVAVTSLATSALTISAVGKGATTVTVTATDTGGLTAQHVFRVMVPNRAPETLGPIPDQTLDPGQMLSVDLSLYFSDPDGDQLTWSTAVSAPGVVDAMVSGHLLQLDATGRGHTAVMVTARDPEGLTADQTFDVMIRSRPPVSLGPLPDQTVNTGETIGLDVSAYFDDPDGDPLTYDAVSAEPETVAVTASGANVSISGVARGEATITVVASDPGGLQAQSSFRVTVVEARSGSFQIDLVFATPMSSSQEAAFRDAAERWMSILADTELPDVTDRTLDCAGEYEQSVETLDDLMIVAAVVDIDGPGNILGQARPCYAHLVAGTHQLGSLPYFGMMEFDVADLERMEGNGTLKAVILHEIAHVLGIGSLWRLLDLLHNPSLAAGREVDTYLPLPLAVAAFDQAGGESYTGGGKVPVENTGTRTGSDDGHWRKSVFGPELMTWSISSETPPLSAITIQALADLGYTVDAGSADPYRLPTAAAVAESLENSIDLGNDIIPGPLVITDRNGRVVRIIPPPN